VFRSAASSETPGQHSVRSGPTSKQRVVGSSPTGGAKRRSSWGDVVLQQLFTGCLDDEELDANPMAKMPAGGARAPQSRRFGAEQVATMLRANGHCATPLPDETRPHRRGGCRVGPRPCRASRLPSAPWPGDSLPTRRPGSGVRLCRRPSATRSRSEHSGAPRRGVRSPLSARPLPPVPRKAQHPRTCALRWCRRRR
jgi:hypothetical protein